MVETPALTPGRPNGRPAWAEASPDVLRDAPALDGDPIGKVGALAARAAKLVMIVAEVRMTIRITKKS
jgi:hypothetical protein